MSNITITHADSGLIHARVIRREHITPHMVRVTLGGGTLGSFRFRGFDQWFRLAIPVRDDDRLDTLPDRFDVGGFLRYLVLPRGTRPVIRNYTVRGFRSDPTELDIDFVVHGIDGVAAPWASSVEVGAEVALIDQGCGWRSLSADWVLLVGDETGLPAVAGVLRDLPDDARGHAFIELFDARDRQRLDVPEGVQVHWLDRGLRRAPGDVVVPAVRQLTFPPGAVAAFAVGESSLATSIRRHLVNERGIPKDRVTFCGYWKRGRPSG